MFASSENIIDIDSMFHYCLSLTAINLINFNTSKDTNMYQMFKQCISLKHLDLSSFDTAQIEKMDYMFSGCSILSILYLSHNVHH